LNSRHRSSLERTSECHTRYAQCGDLTPHASATIPIVLVRDLLSGVQAKGKPTAAHLADAGIAPELLEQNNSGITAAQYITLFRSLMDGLGDETLGFLSHPLKRGSYALLGRSAISAITVASAMRRMARTFSILQNDLTLEIVRKDQLAGLAIRFNNSDVARQTFLHLLILRGFWRLLVWLAGDGWAIRHFDFAFEPPSYADNYNYALGAPVRFRQEQSAFWFDVSHLEDRVLKNEDALHTFMADAPSQIILPRKEREPMSVRVRGHFLQKQPAWPNLTATARALNMSPSTVQRRLASEGAAFLLLKDKLRRDIAIRGLQKSNISLAALAADLGFADSTSFQRAFKRWTGSAPATYRRNIAGRQSTLQTPAFRIKKRSSAIAAGAKQRPEDRWDSAK
jgi:AraC-like DNA-binding protein